MSRENSSSSSPIDVATLLESKIGSASNEISSVDVPERAARNRSPISVSSSRGNDALSRGVGKSSGSFSSESLPLRSFLEGGNGGGGGAGSRKIAAAFCLAICCGEGLDEGSPKERWNRSPLGSILGFLVVELSIAATPPGSRLVLFSLCTDALDMLFSCENEPKPALLRSCRWLLSIFLLVACVQFVCVGEVSAKHSACVDVLGFSKFKNSPSLKYKYAGKQHVANESPSAKRTKTSRPIEEPITSC